MCYMLVFNNIQCLPPFVWNTHEDFATSSTWRVTVVSSYIPISMVTLIKKSVFSSGHEIMITYLLKTNWKVVPEGLSSGHPNKRDLLLGEVCGQ